MLALRRKRRFHSLYIADVFGTSPGVLRYDSAPRPSVGVYRERR